MKLTIKPIGGLGNRLLALDSAIELAKSIDADQLIVIWEKNQNLMSEWQDLWLPVTGIQIKEINGFNKYSIATYFNLFNAFRPNHFRYSSFNKMLGKERKSRKIFYADDIDPLIKSRFDFRSLRDHSSVYIAAFQRFFPNPKPFSYLNPINEIANKATAITKSFDAHTVGIHIRRTDQELSKQYSPDVAFVKIMKEAINADEKVKFYLATDSEETEKKMQSIFKGRILGFQRNYNRFCKEGIQNAVIDMICLSKTNKIYGSYGSTFTQVASEMENCDLEIVGGVK